MKTRKTMAKRVKITKTGKIMKRKAGQDHFNSRERSKVTRAKRRDVVLTQTYARTIKSNI
jgi:ribosomal protein L35